MFIFSKLSELLNGHLNRSAITVSCTFFAGVVTYIRILPLSVSNFSIALLHGRMIISRSQMLLSTEVFIILNVM